MWLYTYIMVAWLRWSLAVNFFFLNIAETCKDALTTTASYSQTEVTTMTWSDMIRWTGKSLSIRDTIHLCLLDSSLSSSSPSCTHNTRSPSLKYNTPVCTPACCCMTSVLSILGTFKLCMYCVSSYLKWLCQQHYRNHNSYSSDNFTDLQQTAYIPK